MADTLVKKPKLIVGTQSQVEAEMGANDIGFATDVEFYTKAETDALFNGKADRNLLNTTDNVDIVVESQLPTAENNYTWYRKYKSGWVEQSGRWTGSMSLGKYQTVTASVTLPIEMASSEYYSEAWCNQNNNVKPNCGYGSAANTSTVLKVNVKELINTATTIERIDWYVCGKAA